MGYNHSCFRRSKSQISHRMEKGPSTIGRFPSWDGTILRQKNLRKAQVKKTSRSENENVVKKPCMSQQRRMFFLLILVYLGPQFS